MFFVKVGQHYEHKIQILETWNQAEYWIFNYFWSLYTVWFWMINSYICAHIFVWNIYLIENIVGQKYWYFQMYIYQNPGSTNKQTRKVSSISQGKFYIFHPYLIFALIFRHFINFSLNCTWWTNMYQRKKPMF